MAHTYNATQKIIVNVTAEESVVDKLVSDISKLEQHDAEYEYDADTNEYVVYIYLEGSVKYYPSHSWYDPDEYEYDEVFVGDDDYDWVRNGYFKDYDLEIESIVIKDIEYR